MAVIENNKYRVSIDQNGAEITSIQNKLKDNYEYIWNDQSGKFWHRHSPILFPATGRSNDDRYKLEGKIYPMMQHGFVRDCVWQEVEHSSHHVTFRLSEDKKYFENYPFRFTIAVTYTVNEQGLFVETKVTNNDEKKMPFALGFHPAFNIVQDSDGIIDDYELILSPVNKPLTRFSPGKVPFISGKIEALNVARGNKIKLTHDLLDLGFILVANEEIKRAELRSANSNRSIIIDLGNFPYLNIWSQEQKKAPFICVEPFAGLPDIESDSPTDWYQKKGNSVIKKNETKDFYFQIELY